MYEYNCKLLKIVDGDTIDVLIDLGFHIYIKERVRLYGINAPECRTRDLEEKKRGIASKNRLREIIKSFGKNFIIKTIFDKKGKYGRILGEVYDADKKNCANKILLNEGHAVEYFVTPKKLTKRKVHK